MTDKFTALINVAEEVFENEEIDKSKTFYKKLNKYCNDRGMKGNDFGGSWRKYMSHVKKSFEDNGNRFIDNDKLRYAKLQRNLDKDYCTAAPVLHDRTSFQSNGAQSVGTEDRINAKTVSQDVTNSASNENGGNNNQSSVDIIIKSILKKHPISPNASAQSESRKRVRISSSSVTGNNNLQQTNNDPINKNMPIRVPLDVKKHPQHLRPNNILEMGNEELKLETFPIHTGGNMADKEESQTPEDGLSDSDAGDEAKYPVSDDNALNETVEIHNQSSSSAETSVSVNMLSSSVAEEHDGGQQEKHIIATTCVNNGLQNFSTAPELLSPTILPASTEFLLKDEDDPIPFKKSRQEIAVTTPSSTKTYEDVVSIAETDDISVSQNSCDTILNGTGVNLNQFSDVMLRSVSSRETDSNLQNNHVEPDDHLDAKPAQKIRSESPSFSNPPSTYQISEYCDIFASKKYYDVVIIASDETKIPAHRSILSYYSPGFDEIFEKSTEFPVQIDMKDFDVGTIQAALDFMRFKPDSIVGKELVLLKFATKYNIPKLMESCSINANKLAVTKTNVIEFIQTAYDYNLEKLKQKCLKFLAEKKKEIDIAKSKLPYNILIDLINVL
uniref:BTB domain-containing protein n=1 Tax=Panagrolaimus sp. PS1159 TaxID=55785 RepID=A0AC35FLU3_9BILA